MRNDDLAKRFVLHHLGDPEVWVAYERLALQAIKDGRSHLGVGALTEKLRWESPTQCPSDNFRAFYARMFACAHPEWRNLFMYKPSAADYVNYEPLLDVTPCFDDHIRRAEEALGWEDPQLTLELEETI